MDLRKVESRERKNRLLYVSFNQDFDCFACGTEDGFQVWNCDPLRERFRGDFREGIGIVEMLHRSNLLALVGGGEKPFRGSNKKVMIWDDFQSDVIAEIEFKEEILAVKLKRDRIMVALKHKIFIYDFSEIKLIHQIETKNPRGLLAVAQSANVIAYPDNEPGCVWIDIQESWAQKQANEKLKSLKKHKCHDTDITQITLNSDGTRLASSSAQGTLIRLWDTKTGNRLLEMRRGSDVAVINSIGFTPDSKHLCSSSDHQTIHIFDTAGTPAEGWGGWVPALSSAVRSKVDIKIHDPRSICAFLANGMVIVLCSDGSFEKYKFNAAAGDSKQEERALFLVDT